MSRMRKLLNITSTAMRLGAALCIALAAFSFAAPTLKAQSKGAPGKFDFYVLDLPWGPEFCSIKDVSRDCKPQRGFVVHGLWPQFRNDTWPVFCSDERGQANFGANLDITPNLQLLQHEWDKHGTCSAVGPRRFFEMEHKAFRSVAVPLEFQHLEKEIALTPEWILRSFAFENPSFPPGSFSVSCREGKLTAVEACFSKELRAVACEGIQSCKATVLRLESLIH